MENKFKVGESVTIDCPGSQYHGKRGRVFGWELDSRYRIDLGNGKYLIFGHNELKSDNQVKPIRPITKKDMIFLIDMARTTPHIKPEQLYNEWKEQLT